MSCSLPPELLDHIADHLHDDPTALKACCIVSKSWVTRAQSHLFADVEFDTEKHSFERWMKIFPDSSNSPAHHTLSLSICGLPVVSTQAMDAGGWIRSFHNLVHLKLERLHWERRQAPLITFHGLSPTLRSLHLTSTTHGVFDLVCSFPLLEDLALICIPPESEGDAGRDVHRVSSPKFTGSLVLEGFRPVIRGLLGLPNGLNFVKIVVSCHDEEDARPAMDLISRCSGTLESLTIQYTGPHVAPFLDLSEATKVKNLAFRFRVVKTVTMTLQTIGSMNLGRITIHPYTSVCFGPIGEHADRQNWRELDTLLVRLRTSRSIRLQFIYGPDEGWKDARDHASSLLPELTKTGIVDLVNGDPAAP